MQQGRSERIVVIGAGPKGISIAAKAQVLREIGLSAPKVLLIEKASIASHWNGTNGHTNGKMELGTSPEKDLGFPYDSRLVGPFGSELNQKINEKMRSFSWQEYLISEGTYSDWIDRGRPQPNHLRWANYLKWAASKLDHHTEIVYGEVTALEWSGDQEWMITSQNSKGNLRHDTCDGVVFTGPGKTRQQFPVPENPRIMNIETFWKRWKDLTLKIGDRIGIIGAGENSASMAIALQERQDDLIIDIVSPQGFIYGRGESFWENKVYSHPESVQWKKLSGKERREFIYRTDLGVFSSYANQLLRTKAPIGIIPGRATAIEEEGSDKKPRVTTEYNTETSARTYDYVLMATGFDQLQLLKEIMDPETLKRFQDSMDLQDFTLSHIESRIGDDLSILGPHNLPKLHLPMLSGFAQGPGFANLSCLGRLSDRVLSSYISDEKEHTLTPHVSNVLLSMNAKREAKAL